jgi:hypothetical protein
LQPWAERSHCSGDDLGCARETGQFNSTYRKWYEVVPCLQRGRLKPHLPAYLHSVRSSLKVNVHRKVHCFFPVAVRTGRVSTDHISVVADGHMGSVDVCIRCDSGRVVKQSKVALIVPKPVTQPKSVCLHSQWIKRGNGSRGCCGAKQGVTQVYEGFRIGVNVSDEKWIRLRTSSSRAGPYLCFSLWTTGRSQ